MNEKERGGEVYEAETAGFNHKGWLASVAGREHNGFRLCGCGPIAQSAERIYIR